MLGIIGAMDEEISQIAELMTDVEETTIAEMTFKKGTIGGKEVVAVRSGIGKVNAAMCTQILATYFHVDSVINTGVAGSLRNEINIGDIVISTDALQHDMDATGFGYELGVIPRMKVSTFVADDRLAKLAKEACIEANLGIGVHCGRVVSGDQFITDKATKQRLIDTFDGYCTEMEGAAIAQAAYLNGIPFLVIRAISDKADDSANMDYSEFERHAIDNSVALMKILIANI
ncbi:MAG: 5'-methylthioadenosine/adenosylhomocysteine nucleosidase [Butyrivibrio sp.]|nr:5'-methylthioadenosine/adenosylhomocysteine nucleosidase [Butyrivibrio sp.]